MAAHEDTGSWVINTRELVRRPGAMRTVEKTIEAPEAIGTDVVAVPAGAPVALQVRLESVVEGVLASGSVSATATAECVRCLDPVSVDVDVTFQELFAYPERAAHHHEVAEDDQDEVHELDGDIMDLESVVRDAVVPALPFQPVCREDCPGLCSQCGARLEEDPGHQHEVIDPRWAALADLASQVDTDDEKRN